MVDTNTIKKISILFSIWLVVVILGACIFYKLASNKNNNELVFNDISVVDFGVAVPTGNHVMSMSEFETFQSTGNTSSFVTYSDYSTYVNNNSSVTVKESGANGDLYSIADEYFLVYYDTERVSPLFPMALANVETPSRADSSKTWSALFPSKYVSTDLMRSFNVTDVISDATIFKALSSEVSTRDRGALQMSPTYGTDNKEINKLMSGTEKDKLKTVDTSKHKAWADGASGNAGDRFYLPDVLLRMRAASSRQISNMIRNNYQPKTDMQLIAMLAMGHHSSGVWYHSNPNKSVGCWKSGKSAYDFATKVGDIALISKIKEYADTSKNLYIDSNVAKKLYYEVYGENFSTYATKDIVCTYPIKVLYAYVKLSTLYTQ